MLKFLLELMKFRVAGAARPLNFSNFFRRPPKPTRRNWRFPAAAENFINFGNFSRQLARSARCEEGIRIKGGRTHSGRPLTIAKTSLRCRLPRIMPPSAQGVR